MAEADISAQLENTSAALGNFQTSLSSLASSMSTQSAVADKVAKAEQKRFKGISKGLGDAAKKMGDVGKKLGIIAGITFSMKGVLDILMKVERATTKFAKNLGTTRGQADQLFKEVVKVEKSFNLIGLSIDDAAQAAGALAQEFGSAGKVNDKMINGIGRLNKAFGISIGEAASFTERMTEAGYEIENFTDVLAKDALRAGVNLGVAFRDVVKNVGMMEIYAGRSAEELADMVTSAAQLGVSVGSFEKAAGAWKDFETMSENIGRTSRLFGASFENALPPMTELRRMWSQMMDVELVEEVTEGFVATTDLVLKNGKEILVDRRTGLKLNRDQLEVMATMYGGDLEFGKRSIKQQHRFTKFLEKRGEFDKIHLTGLADEEKAILDGLKVSKKQQNSTAEKDIKAVRAAKKQFTAINDIVRAQNKGVSLYDLQGEAQKAALKNALETQAVRNKEAEVVDGLNKVIQDGMGFLERMGTQLTAVIQPAITSISLLFSEVLNDHIMPFFDDLIKAAKDVFSQEGDGAFNISKMFEKLNKEGGVIDIIKAFATKMTGMLKGGIIAAFDLKPAEGEKNVKFMDVLKNMASTASDVLRKGIIGAFSLKTKDVKDDEQSWGDIAGGIMDKIVTVLKEGDLAGKIRKLFIAAFNFTKEDGETVSEDTGWKSLFDIISADASNAIKRGIINAFALKDESGEALNPLQNTLGDVMSQAANELIDNIIKYLKVKQQEISDIFTPIISSAVATALQMAENFKDDMAQDAGGWFKEFYETEAGTLEREAQERRNREARVFEQQYDAMNKTQQASQVGIDLLDKAMAIKHGTVPSSGPNASHGYQPQPGEKATGAAKGWSGTAHRAIVGEAGTEVGITRNALRELASAGIPGYANGGALTAVGQAGRNRRGLSQQRASVGGKEDAHESSAAESAAYQNALNNFLRRQDDFLEAQEEITEKRHKIWMRDQKEFFVRYPGVINGALAPLAAEGGPWSTGIYNSIFSGMQAGTKAELAGADKDTQRGIMYQHMAATALQPGGVVDLGFKWLGEQQNKHRYVLEGGLEKEQAELARLQSVNVEMKDEFAAAKETDREALNVADKQNQNLKEVQARVDAAKRSAEGAAVAQEALAEIQAQLTKEEWAEIVEDTRVSKEALDLAEKDLVTATATAVSSAKTAEETSASRKIAEDNLKENREQTADQRTVVKNQEKELAKGAMYHKVSVGLLGGIQSGLAAAAATFAAGGSKGQARKAAGKGILGGLIKDFSGTFGSADPKFLQTFDTVGMLMGTYPMPNVAGNTSDIINRAMAGTENTLGRNAAWGGRNAQGRVFTSPHLAMVGEGSANEIIVPTERIRKGLPINAGVARELGSIGVPGYEDGEADLYGRAAAGQGSGKKAAATQGDIYKQDSQRGSAGLFGFAGGEEVKGHSATGLVGFGGMYEGGSAFTGGGRASASMENLKNVGIGGGLATGGLAMANTLLAGGSFKEAAFQGIGAGVGFAATAALTPFLGPFAPLAGGIIGGLVGKGLGALFGSKPKYKRYRKRSVTSLEDFVKSRGTFRWGEPEGIEENLKKAISGKKEKQPSEKAYNKLKKEILANKTVGRKLRKGSIDSFINLLSGGVQDAVQGEQQYEHFNKLFYGRRMAEGGVVTGPTSAVIGEEGPEAVIPLDRYGSSNRYGGYPSQQQQQNSVDMVSELKKQNQQMQMFIKKIGEAKTVLQVDGRQLAETVGQNMYDINTGA